MYSEKLTTTYPKYETEWHVSAKPNGDLIDLNTGRSLYGLYWEGLNTVSNGIQEEGFVVKGEDTIVFLEEKLAILGLTEREANEFISNGAISINGEIVKDNTLVINKSIALDSEIVVIRRGKKKYYLCNIK